MPFVMSDGKGQKIAIYSSCVDISYAQAEVLLMVEEIKKTHSDPFIVAFFDQMKAISVPRFLSAFEGSPSSRKRLEELQAEVKAKGFSFFAIKPFQGDFEQLIKDKALLQIGRCVDDLVDEVAEHRKQGDDSELPELIEDIYANPLHAGVHHDFKASISDEIWIQEAMAAIKRTTLDRWLRRLLLTLRFYLKGRPKVPLPHKNDRCPCGSSKKYGKCCGAGIDAADPEECKIGNHTYGAWEKIEAKWIRNCDRCFRIEEAPWCDESVFEGVKVFVMGCRACASRPTAEDIHKEIGRAIGWHTCGSCGKAFTLDKVVVEHEWADGKHSERWVATEIEHTEESVDLECKALWKGVFVHKDCFMKALPAWPHVAKPLGGREENTISREITPAQPAS